MWEESDPPLYSASPVVPAPTGIGPCSLSNHHLQNTKTQIFIMERWFVVVKARNTSLVTVRGALTHVSNIADGSSILIHRIQTSIICQFILIFDA